MSSSSSRSFAAFTLVLLGASFVATAACDDPVKPIEDDGKVKKAISPGCNGSTPAAKGFFPQTKVTVKGQERTYDWLVPDLHDGVHPIPVIFMFHGDGGTGAQIRTGFPLEPVVAGKAVFIYPDALAPTKKWDLDHGADNNPDVAFFDSILESLSTAYCIDLNRVFITGHSGGAYFSNQLACGRGGALRAVASHGGGGPFGNDSNAAGELQCPEKPIAAIVTHGADDAEVALSEGQATRDYWGGVNGCRKGGLEPFDPSPCIHLLDCATDRPVVYCEVPNIGHNLWSEAPRATWNFFDSL